MVSYTCGGLAAALRASAWGEESPGTAGSDAGQVPGTPRKRGMECATEKNRQTLGQVLSLNPGLAEIPAKAFGKGETVR